MKLKIRGVSINRATSYKKKSHCHLAHTLISACVSFSYWKAKDAKERER